jgi:predicted ATP-dependent serine protease
MTAIYFNMEMIDFDFAQRLIMAGAGIKYRDMKFNPKDQSLAVANLFTKYARKNLFFSRGKSMSIHEIITHATQTKREKGLEFIVVDYDQKIALQTSRDTPEWKALQLAVENLEELAKRLNIYVLLLAQENLEGGVSGSRRSMFPASTVMRFYQDDSGNYLIKAIKNRFGKTGATIEVEYDHERNQVRERGPFLDSPAQKNNQVIARPALGAGEKGSTKKQIKPYRDD